MEEFGLHPRRSLVVSVRVIRQDLGELRKRKDKGWSYKGHRRAWRWWLSRTSLDFFLV
ncbi:hypothetical protein N665_0202s0004 [Sinapis alba]|nr:hypothetical protein N665_0202s0004 [Sinapis alba]